MLSAIVQTSLPGEEFGQRLEAARKRLPEGPRISRELELKALPRPGMPK
jgi:hypothetical protein